MHTISIIWWWAAWMMIAATILTQASDDDVFHINMFEKNTRLGAKVRISGGWRCNVTTWYYKKQDLQGKYIRGQERLRDAMGCWSPRQMKARCESMGVPMKTEDDMRVFPVSNNSDDIVGIFEALFAQNNHRITVQYETSIVDVQLVDNVYIMRDKKGQIYTSDILCLTTWWNAYSHTWSTGDGYAFARALGHTITPLGPSLNSFITSTLWTHSLSGLSFPHATIHWLWEKWQPQSQIGPILLTHFGITWPAIFAFAAHIPYVVIDENNIFDIYIQPFADRDVQWRQWWLQDMSLEYPKKQIKTLLQTQFSDRFVDAYLSTYEIDPTIWMTNLSKDHRKTIASSLGIWLQLSLVARRAWDEFVTVWWVPTDEIDSKTMQSIYNPTLYMAGELLNIDGITGWYNLQACRATGRSAWKSIVSWLWFR